MRHHCGKIQFNDLYLNDSVVLSKLKIFLLVDTKIFLRQPLDEQLFLSFAPSQGVAAQSTLGKEPKIAALTKTQHPERNCSKFLGILLYPRGESGRQ